MQRLRLNSGKDIADSRWHQKLRSIYGRLRPVRIHGCSAKRALHRLVC